METGATENFWESIAEQLATMNAKYITSEWYPFDLVYVHESESAQPIHFLTTSW